MSNRGWIGIDLDGTLAFYYGWREDGGIEEPVPAELKRVQGYLAEKKLEVRIFTARVASTRPEVEREEQRKKIQEWCQKYLGRVLTVTAEKDFDCVWIEDDRAIQIMKNMGLTLEEYLEEKAAKKLLGANG